MCLPFSTLAWLCGAFRRQFVTFSAFFWSCDKETFHTDSASCETIDGFAVTWKGIRGIFASANKNTNEFHMTLEKGCKKDIKYHYSFYPPLRVGTTEHDRWQILTQLQFAVTEKREKQMRGLSEPFFFLGSKLTFWGIFCDKTDLSGRRVVGVTVWQSASLCVQLYIWNHLFEDVCLWKGELRRFIGWSLGLGADETSLIIENRRWYHCILCRQFTSWPLSVSFYLLT